MVLLGILFANFTLNYFLIRAGKRQPENIKSPRLLILAGIINLMAGIALFFLPTPHIYNYSTEELQIFKGMKLLFWIIYAGSSAASFGVLFTIFGWKNRKIVKNYLITGGVVMITMGILQITASSILYTVLYGTSYTIEGNYVLYTYIAISDIILTFYALSFAFFVAHSKLNHDKNILCASLMIIMIHGLGFIRNTMVAIYL
jgi:hypothetical protein